MSEKNTEEKIKEALNIACEICKKEANGLLLKIWQVGLADYSTAKIDYAIENYCKHNKSNYMPTPAEFMEFGEITKYPYL